MRILIADDSRTIRVLLSSLLKQMGYTDLVEAENGLTACDRCASGGVNMVFLDLHMPVIDGLATLRLLKGSAATANIPVLIVSSDSDMRKVEEARELGALGYIRKPFTPDSVRAAIDAAMKVIGTRRFKT